MSQVRQSTDYRTWKHLLYKLGWSMWECIYHRQQHILWKKPTNTMKCSSRTFNRFLLSKLKRTGQGRKINYGSPLCDNPAHELKKLNPVLCRTHDRTVISRLSKIHAAAPEQQQCTLQHAAAPVPRLPRPAGARQCTSFLPVAKQPGQYTSHPLTPGPTPATKQTHDLGTMPKCPWLRHSSSQTMPSFQCCRLHRSWTSYKTRELRSLVHLEGLQARWNPRV